ncbi:MAG: VOC family protein [Acidobacteriota bacterium]|jgi:PhnB protein|nr:VOC family protein [Acidobacteriota bacterium]
MTDKVKPIPDGYHTLTPHLTVRDAARALDFYQKAFGAQILHVHKMPDGKIMHATIKIGDSLCMLNDEFPEWQTLSPVSTAGSGVTLHIQIEDVDTAFKQAVSAGATVKMPLMDMFWGDRYGTVSDPFGHTWSLATHVRDVSPEEMQQASEAMSQEMPKSA